MDGCTTTTSFSSIPIHLSLLFLIARIQLSRTPSLTHSLTQFFLSNSLLPLFSNSLYGCLPETGTTGRMVAGTRCVTGAFFFYSQKRACWLLCFVSFRFGVVWLYSSSCRLCVSRVDDLPSLSLSHTHTHTHTKTYRMVH